MTYNVRRCAGPTGRTSSHLGSVAQVIARYEPAIVALNEVYGTPVVPGTVDQVNALARTAGYPYSAFGPAAVRFPRRYGNALLSRFPVERTTTIPLTEPKGTEPRSLLVATLRLSDRIRLHVLVVHLGLTRQGRSSAVDTILQVAGATAGDPVVLLGDFNVGPDDEVLERLAEQFTDAASAAGDARPTFPAHAPIHRIDYVLVNAHVDVVDTFAVDEPASDHLPVAAHLRVRR